MKNESSQTSRRLPFVLSFCRAPTQVQFWEMFLSNQMTIIHFSSRNLLNEWKQISFKDLFFFKY